MKKLKRILSVALTLAMALSLFDATALGLYLELGKETVSVGTGESSKGIVALYDKSGKMITASDNVAAPQAEQTIKAMELNAESGSPQVKAIELAGGKDGAYLVPQGVWLDLSGQMLAIPQGTELVIEPGAELFINDMNSDGSCRIALGGVLYAYGSLNVGDWSRRIGGMNGTWGKFYVPYDMNGFAQIVGEFFGGSNAVPRDEGEDNWASTDTGRAIIDRILHENDMNYDSLGDFFADLRQSDDWRLRDASWRLNGYDVLFGCNALTLDVMTEENGYDPLVTEDMAAGMLYAIWRAVNGDDAPEKFAFSDAVESEAYPGITLYSNEHRSNQDDENGWWDGSFYQDVNAYLRKITSSALASATNLTIRSDDGGVYADAGSGAVCYDAIEGVTFSEPLTVRVEGGVGDRLFAFNNCTFEQGADVVFDHVRNANLEINGVHLGNAHVFSYEEPYGVYTGMPLSDFEENVTDFAIYPGRWNEERRETEFDDEPIFTMEDDEQYSYDINSGGEVNINAADDPDWIRDPYQVRLVLNLKGGVTVTYDTLMYKEGQMAIADFAANVRGMIGKTLAAVTNEDRAAVESEWNEGEYRERLDDFAFAVKYGDLTRPTEDNEWTADATHYWNAWDDLRYGTAKAILESVYVAAWSDDEHTSLPDSVKLINEQGKEWHGENDSFQIREIDQMLGAFERELPGLSAADLEPREYETITVKRADDGWMYALPDNAEDTEENRIDANLSGYLFTKAMTLVIDESAFGCRIDLRNCAFPQGVTIEAPPTKGMDEQGKTVYYGRFTINFHSRCTGSVTVTESESDASARKALMGKTQPQLDGEEYRDEFELLFYWDAVGLENADGLEITSNSARVGVNMSGGTVTLNGVEYSASDEYNVCVNYTPDWKYNKTEKENVLYGATCRTTALGCNYDDGRQQESLAKTLTVSGKADTDFYLRGIVDVSGLVLTDGSRLVADYDSNPDNWCNHYLTLAEGQTLEIPGDWGIDLRVNGERIERPAAQWDDRDVRIDVPDGYEGASVYQWRDENGGWTNITNELERNEHGEGVSFSNSEYGWSEEDDRWYPLNGDSIYGTQVRLTMDGVTLVFDPVLRNWERPVSLGELGERLLEWLQRNDQEELAFDGFTVAQYLKPDENVDAANVALLESIWNDRTFGEWAGREWRGCVAFALRLLPNGEGSRICDRYNDPGEVIRWGDAKALFTAVLVKLGKSADEIRFYDGWLDENGVEHDPRRDEYGLDQGGKDSLYDQFVGQLPQADVEGAVAIVLNRGEHGERYTMNGEPADSNEIMAKRFLGKVTLTYGENTNEGDDWGGELLFRNCSFACGLEVVSDETLPFRVDFDNSCSGEITFIPSDYSWVQFWNVKGMTFNANNGVSFDATKVKGGANVNVCTHEVSAYVDGCGVNFVQLGDWDGCIVQLRLNSDFLSEDDIELTLNDEPLDFSLKSRWEDNEHVVELRGQKDKLWFDRENAAKVTLTLALPGATLTLTPPPLDWERPANRNYFKDRLLNLLEEWERHEADDYLNGQSGDDHLSYGEAIEILAGVWRILKNDGEAALPASIALEGKDEEDILSNGEADELVYGCLQYSIFLGEYAGNSAEELQAMLNSGRQEIALTRDLTLDGDVIVPENVSLVVKKDVTLTVPEGCVVRVDGDIINMGTITGGGALVISEDGTYINEIEDHREGVLGVENVTANGDVVCFVAEKADGTLVKQDVFVQIGEKVDFRAVVYTQNGFDNAARDGYNQCIIADDGRIVSSTDASFARLVAFGDATLTVQSGTLTVGTLELRGGSVTVAEGAELIVTDTSNNGGSLTVNGAMSIRIASGREGFHNNSGFTVNGTLNVYDSDLYNQPGGSLVVNGKVMLTDDPETEGWMPALYNEGELLVNGTLELSTGAFEENGVWFDENGIHFSRFVVSGTVTVAEGATLRNYVDIDFEERGTVANSGKVYLIEVQDFDDRTGTYTAPDLNPPAQIRGEGEIAFYVLVGDNDGFAAAAAQNRNDALPQVEECELSDDITYEAERMETLSFEVLNVQDHTLTLGNVALRIGDRIEGDGCIVLTEGASLTCPADNYPGDGSVVEVVGGGAWSDNGDGTVTIRTDSDG